MATNPPKQSRIPVTECNLAKAFDQIGDRWSLLILRSAFYGLRRFGDIQQELGIPRTVLSNRLKKFVELDIMVTRNYREPGQRPRPEYFLTQKGADLAVSLIALNQWGDKWLGKGTAPLEFLDRETNKPVVASLAADPATAIPMSQIKRRINI
ncbi:helix-turn-helix transcriptional regulator [Parvularcula flava]|uniref:Helix-turn-helix transcriptional regulator n=1 Tax=Aquisalinus luteolus TaxID=1566827 RepID=A0A8J3A7W9_9PROT|nr:helix-turn-helix domain-containing protein [Aquisalinus luteolus]NHK28595.1 helix-turn-helix transcriptional regulator [Aquisalinus luteolus]GGH98949.1 HxlR family transcriptional regulator [Aquisalinus luteolus]